MTEKGLPWHHLNCPNKSNFKEALQMKLNFDYYMFCGTKYEFLADSLEFLRKYEKKMNILNILY